ncbi:thermonuclease family protein [Nitrosospira sp. Is2]|uniref:thermonuclease family protein n=1 Tax=Nitrosospira sp. Is2 TaxID=3080532 RepID=UPI002953B5D5|nr:thermonuclease family protein [Nitrosospira sp. Is2]WON74037.1 thermonuclease family protein [Nitrosospira sp. Is2]
MRPAIAVLVLVPWLTLPDAAFAAPNTEPIHAQVLQIVDGDSVTVSIDGELVRVRLAEIDAPELDQPFATESRQSLFDLCLWVHAELTSISRDYYGRTLARVECNGVDVNAEQVRRGLAWVKNQAATDKKLHRLQEEAKAAKRGLWAFDSPTPPWEWRSFHNFQPSE